MKMIRKEFRLDRRRAALLTQKARELGVAEAEIIRRGIHPALSDAGLAYPDYHAWEQMKEFIRTRRRMNVPHTGRTWTREELYRDIPGGDSDS